VAKFLEAQGFKEEALAVSTDTDHKFELACDLGELETGLELMNEIMAAEPDEKDSIDNQAKWKRLSDLALKQSKFELAIKCAESCSDYSGLLLMYTALADADGVRKLAQASADAGKVNIAFLCYHLLGEVEKCVDLLIGCGRLPEAAFFARTYLPSKVDSVMEAWKADLSKTSASVAESLCTPSSDPESFPDFDVALKVEQMFIGQRAAGGLDAGKYLDAKDDLALNLIDMMKSGKMAPPASVAAAKEPEPAAPVSPPAPAPADPGPEADPVDDGAALKAEEEAAQREAEAAAAAKAQAEAQAAAEAQREAEAAAAAAAEAEAAAAAAAAEQKRKEEEAAAAVAAAAAEQKRKEEEAAAAKAAEEAENDALADEFADDW
jgi:coatomer subunit beta'